jgi:hypothetical protein
MNRMDHSSAKEGFLGSPFPSLVFVKKFSTLTMAVLFFLEIHSARAVSTFGFNYWPAGQDCRLLTTANWTTENKNIVKRELDHMASLGGGLIRFMFWPQFCGWELSPGSSPGGATFTSEFTQMTQNLPELLGMCAARNIKVTIAFGNNFQDAGPNPPTTMWWMTFYGTGTTNYTRFLRDTHFWINGFVDAAEGSTYASTVMYYDIQNEYYRNNPYQDWYSTFVFDWCSMPAAKKGHSVLSVALDAEALRVAMGPRVLRFTEFHPYPAQGGDTANIEWAYDQMRSKFPSAACHVGEFGRPCANPGEETAQQSTLLDVANRCKTKGIPYHMHWMFQDNAISNPNPYGLSYSDHSMKDSMGGLSSVENLASNPDCESVSGRIPSGWGGGSSDGSYEFVAMGPDKRDACTNSYYARLTRRVASGSVWVNVPTFNVQGGKNLYVNAFIRSNMIGIHLDVHRYDANWGDQGTVSTLAYNPRGWSFNNFLARVGSFCIPTTANTKKIIISVCGTSVSNPSYLDVDTVSAFER